MQNYYQILNLEKFSSAELVKKQYRVLVKQYHPDVNPNEDAKYRFLAIQEAYECLIDGDRKREYDNFLKGKPSAAFNKTAKSSPADDLPKHPVKHYKRSINNIRNKIRDIEFFNLYNLKTELDKILNESQAKHLYNNSTNDERTEIFIEILPFVETLNEYPVFNDYVKILQLIAGNNSELKSQLTKFKRVNFRKNLVPRPVAIGCSSIMAMVAFVIIYMTFIYEPTSDFYKISVVKDADFIEKLSKQYIQTISENPSAKPQDLELKFSQALYNNKNKSCYVNNLEQEKYCRTTGSSIKQNIFSDQYDIASSNTIILENNYVVDMLFVMKEVDSDRIFRNELVLPGEKYALLYLPNKEFNWYAQYGTLIDTLHYATKDYPLKFKSPNYFKHSFEDYPIKFNKRNKQKVYLINFTTQPER